MDSFDTMIILFNRVDQKPAVICEKSWVFSCAFAKRKTLVLQWHDFLNSGFIVVTWLGQVDGKVIFWGTFKVTEFADSSEAVPSSSNKWRGRPFIWPGLSLQKIIGFGCVVSSSAPVVVPVVPQVSVISITDGAGGGVISAVRESVEGSPLKFLEVAVYRRGWLILIVDDGVSPVDKRHIQIKSERWILKTNSFNHVFPAEFFLLSCIYILCCTQKSWYRHPHFVFAQHTIFLRYAVGNCGNSVWPNYVRSGRLKVRA